MADNIQKYEAQITLPLAVVVEDRGFESPCWIWRGPIVNKKYGQIPFGSKMVMAHRAVYMSVHGVIGSNIEVHHRCRQTLCVNPDHLQALTKTEHRHLHHPIREFCKRGHRLAGENVMHNANGSRQCRVCRDAAMLLWRQKNYSPRARPRPTHCRNGHEYTPENTYVNPLGHRACKICRQASEVRCRPARALARRRPRVKPTHCPHGHEYTPENTAHYRGAMRCRQCDRDRALRRYHELKRLAAQP